MIGKWCTLNDSFDGDLIIVEVVGDAVGNRTSVGEMEILMEVSILGDISLP